MGELAGARAAPGAAACGWVSNG